MVLGGWRSGRGMLATITTTNNTTMFVPDKRIRNAVPRLRPATNAKTAASFWQMATSHGKKACACRSIRHQSVTHQKPLKKSKNKALSTLAGTQTLDRTWLSLKTWLGKSPEAKGKMDDDSCSRQELRKQISQWAWSKRCASLSRAISCSPLYSNSAEPES